MNVRVLGDLILNEIDERMFIHKGLFELAALISNPARNRSPNRYVGELHSTILIDQSAKYSHL